MKALKIFEYILVSILLCLIILFGYYIISRIANKNSYSKMFGYYMFEVTSGSMYNPEEKDSLNVGALIFVKKHKDGNYKVGDVITFKRDTDKNPITHKIIEINGDMITTKGINPANSPDTPFDKQFVIGEVKGVWQNYAKVINFIKSPFGLVLIIVIGVGMFFGIDAMHKCIKKHDESLKEENKEDKKETLNQENN